MTPLNIFCIYTVLHQVHGKQGITEKLLEKLFVTNDYNSDVRYFLESRILFEYFIFRPVYDAKDPVTVRFRIIINQILVNGLFEVAIRN
jgi:hypothetical protein